MKKFKMTRKYIVPVTALGTLAMASVASAEPVLDFTGATSAITAELSPAVASAMPILGIGLAIALGVKIYRRFAK